MILRAVSKQYAHKKLIRLFQSLHATHRTPRLSYHRSPYPKSPCPLHRLLAAPQAESSVWFSCSPPTPTPSSLWHSTQFNVPQPKATSQACEKLLLKLCSSPRESRRKSSLIPSQPSLSQALLNPSSSEETRNRSTSRKLRQSKIKLCGQGSDRHKLRTYILPGKLKTSYYISLVSRPSDVSYTPGFSMCLSQRQGVSWLHCFGFRCGCLRSSVMLWILVWRLPQNVHKDFFFADPDFKCCELADSLSAKALRMLKSF